MELVIDAPMDVPSSNLIACFYFFWHAGDRLEANLTISVRGEHLGRSSEMVSIPWATERIDDFTY